MTDTIRNKEFDDFIYQSAFELMTPEFMKEFNNDKDV